MATSKDLPAVIYLEQPDGRRLYAEVQKDGRNAYQPILHGIFSQQTTRGGCGIRSCALVLSANALGCSALVEPDSCDVLTSEKNEKNGRPTSKFSTADVDKAGSKKPCQSECGSFHQLDQCRTKSDATSIGVKKAESNRLNVSASGKLVRVSLSRAGIPELPYTEVGLYDMAPTLAVTRREFVSKRGLTLDEVAEILRGHGCMVSAVHAASCTVERFRCDISCCLSDRCSRSGVIVNFHRGPLSSDEINHRAHHSPLAAYHRASDRILVLDTAAPVERHFWVTIHAMFVAMSTVDKVSGLSRGYCVFTKLPSPGCT